MNKMLSFIFGLLMGTIIATAWAQYHNYPTVDSPRNQAWAMAPFDMMTRGLPLPAHQHDAF